jgi:sugar lactone lactonase YvrE
MKQVAVTAGAFVILAGLVHAGFQGGSQGAGKTVVRLDPAMDKLVAPDVKVETLRQDLGFGEGPVWVKDQPHGYLLFSDIAANCIYKWQDGKVSVFLERSGWTGTASSTAGVEVTNSRLYVIVLGSNGLALDPQGRLVIAQHGDRQIVRLEKDGKRTVLASHYGGKHLNSPDDVLVKRDGSIYFSDPPYGLRGGDRSPLKELPTAMYLLKDGKVTRLFEDPGANGLAFSPDEKKLYVTDNRSLKVYDVNPDDTVANGRRIFSYDAVTPKLPADGIFDGIKVDTLGNIWGGGPGGVWVISPAGKALGSIALPDGAAVNVAFGDADGKSLFITTMRSLHRVRLNVPGILPGPK